MTPPQGERSRSLLQAASIIFVLMAVLPLLVFTWVLYRTDALPRWEAQVGLALALSLALTGFVIFRNLMRQLSDFMQVVARAIDAKDRQRPQAAVAEAAQRAPVVTPGIGAITELDDMTQTMASMWRTEALPHVGEEVAVSVMRTTEPVRGTLKEITDDGLLLEHDGKQVAISYQRISGIERDA